MIPSVQHSGEGTPTETVRRPVGVRGEGRRKGYTAEHGISRAGKQLCMIRGIMNFLKPIECTTQRANTNMHLRTSVRNEVSILAHQS